VTEAIRILKDEHRSISAVLLGLKHLAQLAQDPHLKPHFQVFRSMLRYIDEYPERLHHPKEDEHLFARLLQRAPETRGLVEDLKQEHVKGAQLVRDLERGLLFFEEGWPQGAREFLAAVDAYAEFHWNHMRKEEAELLPLAERYLSAEDWSEIGAAFARNADALAGVEERDFQQLFSRIANLAPAPVGLGDAWQKA
jgi:hemerythrin-like domain-containing protein